MAVLHAGPAGADTDPPVWWLNAGVGAGAGGGAWGATLSCQAGPHLVSARGVHTALFDDLWDVGLLYGRGVRGARSSASLSAGVALVGGGSGAFYLGPRFRTVGLPLEAQWYWTPFTHSEVGLGLTAFGNLNAERSFGGLLCCVRLGGGR